MNNIDRFNYFVGRLFADLYGVFPSPMMVRGPIYMEDIVDKEDFDGAFDYDELVNSTLTWLAKADYIDMSVRGFVGSPTEYNIVLSEKGLERMKAIPESLAQQKGSFGEILMDTTKEKAADKVIEVAAKALSYSAGVLADIS